MPTMRIFEITRFRKWRGTLYSSPSRLWQRRHLSMISQVWGTTWTLAQEDYVPSHGVSLGKFFDKFFLRNFLHNFMSLCLDVSQKFLRRQSYFDGQLSACLSHGYHSNSMQPAFRKAHLWLVRWVQKVKHIKPNRPTVFLGNLPLGTRQPSKLNHWTTVFPHKLPAWKDLL